MEPLKRSIAGLSIALCLTAALSACDKQPGAVEITAPVSAQPGSAVLPSADATEVPELLQTISTQLEVDGARIGRLAVLSNVIYVEVASLRELQGLELSEQGETLQLSLGDVVWSLQDGSAEARNNQDGSVVLSAAVLRQNQEKWFLPVDALSLLFKLTPVQDPEAELLHCLRVEEGTKLFFNGVEETGSFWRCNGSPVLTAEQLARLCDGNAESGMSSDGTPTLTLQVGEKLLVFQEGATLAELNGEQLQLPVPAWREGERWMLPVDPIASAAGMTAWINEAGDLRCSRIEACETLLWMNGTQLRAYNLPEGGLYLRLDEAADAAGGSFQTESDTGVLSVWGRELHFREGSAAVDASEEMRQLSAPVLSCGNVWYAPAGELFSALGLTELIDPEQDQRWYTRIVKHDAVPAGYRIPVLMYHAVSDHLWGEAELFASPAILEEEIQAMLNAGYTPITFEDLDHIQEIEKPVMLTFDDGYDDNYTELFPILQKYNVKATVFVIVNDIGKNHKVTEAQIREMSDSGLVSIQS
ncbi:MAG: polysaccharide deacetylase family protein, partial [Oscillospiraceae bacterium]|nr:polysaccharide deacetylase family protein [Oscillospiraceae bacterium]